MNLEPGAVVDDRYTIVATLGEGGMAQVYRARHEGLGVDVALKVLTLAHPSIRKRLMAEGQVQARLRHPNIVSVHDVVDVQGQPGLVMELVEGPSLDELLQARKLTSGQADALAKGIMDGVSFAHAHGVVHRDLKPANIMVAITGTGLVPKVADFGLVKLSGAGNSTTRAGVAMGTPSYMSPEQIRDAKSVDERADIFSLGAILYELLTGDRAFAGGDTLEVFKAIDEGRRPSLRDVVPDVPERMERAVDAALQPDRDHRPATVAELKTLWCGQALSGPWDDDLLQDARQISASDVPATPSASDTFAIDPTDESPESAALLPLGTLDSSEKVAQLTTPVFATRDEVPQTTGRKPLMFAALLFAGLVGIVGLGAVLGLLWFATSRPAMVEPGQIEEVAAPAVETVEETPAPEAVEEAPVEAVAEAPVEDSPALVSAPVASPAEPAPSSDPASSSDPAPSEPALSEPDPAPEPTGADAEPAPTEATAPTTGTVVVEGVSALLQLKGVEKPMTVGPVPPGSYKLMAFFEPGKATEAGEFDIGAGQTVAFDCNPSFHVCRRRGK